MLYPLNRGLRYVGIIAQRLLAPPARFSQRPKTPAECLNGRRIFHGGNLPTGQRVDGLKYGPRLGNLAYIWRHHRLALAASDHLLCFAGPSYICCNSPLRYCPTMKAPKLTTGIHPLLAAILILTASLCHSSAIAQTKPGAKPTGPATKTYTGPFDKGQASYSYYTDKDGERVRHGQYTYTWDRLWDDPFNVRGVTRMVSKETGRYDNGNKVGVWTWTESIFGSLIPARYWRGNLLAKEVDETKILKGRTTTTITFGADGLPDGPCTYAEVALKSGKEQPPTVSATGSMVGNGLDGAYTYIERGHDNARKLTATFDDGLCEGTWTLLYDNLTETRRYTNGRLMSSRIVQESTGQTIHTYTSPDADAGSGMQIVSDTVRLEEDDTNTLPTQLGPRLFGGGGAFGPFEQWGWAWVVRPKNAVVVFSKNDSLMLKAGAQLGQEVTAYTSKLRALGAADTVAVRYVKQIQQVVLPVWKAQQRFLGRDDRTTSEKSRDAGPNATNMWGDNALLDGSHQVEREPTALEKNISAAQKQVGARQQLRESLTSAQPVVQAAGKYVEVSYLIDTLRLMRENHLYKVGEARKQLLTALSALSITPPNYSAAIAAQTKFEARLDSAQAALQQQQQSPTDPRCKALRSQVAAYAQHFSSALAQEQAVADRLSASNKTVQELNVQPSTTGLDELGLIPPLRQVMVSQYQAAFNVCRDMASPISTREEKSRQLETSFQQNQPLVTLLVQLTEQHRTVHQYYESSVGPNGPLPAINKDERASEASKRRRVWEQVDDKLLKPSYAQLQKTNDPTNAAQIAKQMRRVLDRLTERLLDNPELLNKELKKVKDGAGVLAVLGAS